MRILVTGSRNWTDYAKVARGITVALDYAKTARPDDKEIVVVHGGAKGADTLAGEFVYRSRAFLSARGYSIREEVHPADWTKGRRGGPERNAEMVAAGADVCVAFIRNNSSGATGCARAAEAAGIETLRYVA